MSNKSLDSVKKILNANGGSMPREKIIDSMKDTGNPIDLQSLNQLIRKHGDQLIPGASKGVISLKKKEKVPARASVR